MLFPIPGAGFRPVPPDASWEGFPHMDLPRFGVAHNVAQSPEFKPTVYCLPVWGFANSRNGLERFAGFQVVAHGLAVWGCAFRRRGLRRFGDSDPGSPSLIAIFRKIARSHLTINKICVCKTFQFCRMLKNYIEFFRFRLVWFTRINTKINLKRPYYLYTNTNIITINLNKKVNTIDD